MLGKKIKELILAEELKSVPQAEYLLFAADRAQHIVTVIAPELEKKNIIISDRMADSSIVYQGYLKGVDIAIINTINSWTLNGIKPDMTFYLAVSGDVAHERILIRNEKISSFEKDIKSLYLLSEGFDKLYKDRSDVITLDTSLSIVNLVQTAYEHILKSISYE